MNQEKIGNLIKNLRLKNNLTQKQFADKYNISYQAVSKWETGKNIPDISLLKQITTDFNIDINDLLEGNLNQKEYSKNKNKKIFVYIGIFILIGISVFFIFKYFNKDDSFEFKTLTSNCSNFKITGSVAYNSTKSFIYITNIEYCGGNDNSRYKEINCILYEEHDNIKKELDKVISNENNITLEKYLKNLELKADYFSKSCKYYKDNSLYLEIEALNINNEKTYYKIPLILNDCN